MQIKIEKTSFGFLGETIKSMTLCDTVQYQGSLWLVPQWLDRIDLGKTRPKRMIRMDFLKYQKVNNPALDFQYFLNQPFPRDVYEGRAPLIIGGENMVIENPEIEFDHPTSLQ